MNYGKNQLALLKFLEKYPNRWHRIKRRKAIDAAKRLMKKVEGMVFVKIRDTNIVCIALHMPQMLLDQN